MAAVKEEEKAAPSAGPAGAKLFLGGLSWDTTEDKLKEYFSKYGDVQDVVVMRDRHTRKPRGFGFITFSEAASAQAACAESHTIDGRQIDAKPSVPHGEGGQQPRSKKIFVGGLAPETDDAQLKAYFERYGAVVEALVMVDHNSGRSRGFGFVTFVEETSVERVFSAGQMHQLNGKQVEVKSATPKGSGPQSGRGGGRGPASAGGYGIRPYGGGRGNFPGYGGYGYGAGAYHAGFPGYGPAYAGYGAGYGNYGMVGYGTGYAGMVNYGGYGAYNNYGYGQQAPYGAQGGGRGGGGGEGGY